MLIFSAGKVRNRISMSFVTENGNGFRKILRWENGTLNPGRACSQATESLQDPLDWTNCCCHANLANTSFCAQVAACGYLKLSCNLNCFKIDSLCYPNSNWKYGFLCTVWLWYLSAFCLLRTSVCIRTFSAFDSLMIY